MAGIVYLLLCIFVFVCMCGSVKVKGMQSVLMCTASVLWAWSKLVAAIWIYLGLIRLLPVFGSHILESFSILMMRWSALAT